MKSVAFVALTIFAATGVLVPAQAAERGRFTAAQADAGHAVYRAHCARCHGPNLEGGQGPALAGRTFQHSLKTAPATATQLFEFITSHMPGAEPGTLSDRQFLDVFAYLLARNGHRAGDTPLTRARLGKVRLVPSDAR